jgi:Dyp-type peroxidase family
LGLHLFKRYRGNTLGRGREHFGFRDGLSQPEPDPETLQDGWTADAENDVVEPGEIIVGLRDEYGEERAVGPDWVKNGSYLVFRRLRQDVAEFRRTLKRQTPVLAAKIPKVTEDFVAARLVGRWPSGATLDVLEAGQVPPKSDPFPMDAQGDFPKGAPTADDVKIESTDYSEDPRGDGCPVFGHVRRAHPRANPELEPNRHRILRRGIPYGPPLPNGATDHADRGLLFVAYQADISRGFETIQGQWFNSPNTAERSPEIGVTNGWDPIAGVANYPEVASTQPRRVYLHVPGTDTTTTPIDVGRLVAVTAGGYFFAPPIGALKILASGE